MTRQYVIMHTTKIEKPNISMQNQLLYLQDLFHNFIYNNFGGLINEKIILNILI